MKKKIPDILGRGGMTKSMATQKSKSGYKLSVFLTVDHLLRQTLSHPLQVGTQPLERGFNNYYNIM